METHSQCQDLVLDNFSSIISLLFLLSSSSPSESNQLGKVGRPLVTIFSPSVPHISFLTSGSNVPHLFGLNIFLFQQLFLFKMVYFNRIVVVHGWQKTIKPTFTRSLYTVTHYGITDLSFN